MKLSGQPKNTSLIQQIKILAKNEYQTTDLQYQFFSAAAIDTDPVSISATVDYWHQLHRFSSFLQQYSTDGFVHAQNYKQEIWFISGLTLL